jgi:anti-sigma B factor antagonist
METFRIKAVPGDGICTLVLIGEADLAIAQDIIDLGVLSLGEDAIHALIIDLTAVTFIDSTALGALIHLRNVAEDRGRKLVLTSVPDRVLRVLEVTGLDTVFTID